MRSKAEQGLQSHLLGSIAELREAGLVHGSGEEHIAVVSKGVRLRIVPPT